MSWRCCANWAQKTFVIDERNVTSSPALRTRERAEVEQAEDLGVDVVVGEALPLVRPERGVARSRPFEEAVQSRGEDALLLEREREAPFVGEGCLHRQPARALVADGIAYRNPHRVEEHFRKLRVTGHLAQRPHSDAVGVHVADHGGQAPRPGDGRGAGEEDPEVGMDTHA